MQLAEILAAKSPLALRIGKEGMNRLQDLPYHQGLDLMDDLSATLCATEDAVEGCRRSWGKERRHGGSADSTPWIVKRPAISPPSSARRRRDRRAESRLCDPVSTWRSLLRDFRVPHRPLL